MITYPIVQLGQTPQALTTSPPISSFLTNPKGVFDSQIATVEDVVTTKLKDANFRSMLIGGGVGLLAGLLLYPLGQSLMGYRAVKTSETPPQDYAY
jgi:hypothetical protein